MLSADHIGFVIASYAAAVVVAGVLIAWVALDYLTQRRALADLELRGLTRRSAPQHSDPAMQQAKEEA